MNPTVDQLIQSYVPMSEPSLLSLLCLTEPRHGYGIMQKVLEQSGGRVSLGASTVYTILYKMEQDGLIEVVSELDRRKVYVITGAGERVLESETARLTELSSFANAVLARRAGREPVMSRQKGEE